jgi:hypothetical protein
MLCEKVRRIIRYLKLAHLFTICFFVSLLCSCVSNHSQPNFYLIQDRLLAISKLPEEEQSTKILDVIDTNPIFAHQIVKHLLKSKIVTIATIKKVTNLKKISIPKILVSLTTAPIVITPLYHSASVTIHPTNTSKKNYVQYKTKSETSWSSPILLDYEPNSGSFTTSIVNLVEDTLYELRIASLQDSNYVDIAQFRTKGMIHFSASNTYQLSNIYQGGTLDLVKLGIEGSKNNWAKVIGDSNTIISATDAVNSAINIGSNSYIYFENITVKGGGRHAVSSDKAHHIRFNGCNISNWGREVRDVRDGKYYAKKTDNKPINYDSAFSLIKTGVVTIENCQVHSPRTKANSWKKGHPHGSNAVLVDANHPTQDYQGQIVIRNNHFYGTDQHRFNDVIESINNGGPFGGFVRDSAIYNNYLAYANDDIIEIDGSQSNVLIYNNEIEQGYCGISAIPNRQGPSYIFNNYIHNLGDQNNRSWAAIKLGGLVSRPAGKVNIFNNLIKTNSNGIASARYNGDSTFWVDVWSNIIIASNYKKNSNGYNILEKSPFSANKYHNNYVFNSVTKNSLVRVKNNRLFSENNHNYLFPSIESVNSELTLPESYVDHKSITKNSNDNGTMTIGYTLRNH